MIAGWLQTKQKYHCGSLATAASTTEQDLCSFKACTVKTRHMEHIQFEYLGTDISPLDDFSGLQRRVSTVFRPFWQEDVVCGDLHKLAKH